MSLARSCKSSVVERRMHMHHGTVQCAHTQLLFNSVHAHCRKTAQTKSRVWRSWSILICSKVESYRQSGAGVFETRWRGRKPPNAVVPNHRATGGLVILLPRSVRKCARASKERVVVYTSRYLCCNICREDRERQRKYKEKILTATKNKAVETGGRINLINRPQQEK